MVTYIILILETHAMDKTGKLSKRWQHKLKKKHFLFLV